MGCSWNRQRSGNDRRRGSYRVSAQVLSPKPTRWSAPVEFTVIAMNKAIQPGPKAFQSGSRSMILDRLYVASTHHFSS